VRQAACTLPYGTAPKTPPAVIPNDDGLPPLRALGALTFEQFLKDLPKYLDGLHPIEISSTVRSELAELLRNHRGCVVNLWRDGRV
jgi:hypothetical protein